MSLDVDSAVLSSVAYAIGDDTHTESVPSAPRSSDDTSVEPPTESTSKGELKEQSKAVFENRTKGGRGYGRFGHKNRRGPPKFAGPHGFNHDDHAGNHQSGDRNPLSQNTKPLKNKSRDATPSDDINGKAPKSRSRGSRGRGGGRGPPANIADNI